VSGLVVWPQRVFGTNATRTISGHRHYVLQTMLPRALGARGPSKDFSLPQGTLMRGAYNGMGAGLCQTAGVPPTLHSHAHDFTS
jgi:hypothetical protein